MVRRPPSPTLRDGVSVEHAAVLLREAAQMAGNTLNRLTPQSHSDQDYLEWANRQSIPLASILPSDELERLLLTRRY